MVMSFLALMESLEYKKKRGESVVVHHTTRVPFSEFKPFTHFGTKDAARARAYNVATGGSGTEYEKLPKEKQQQLKSQHFDNYSVRLKLGKVAHIDDIINHSPEGIAKQLHTHGHITTDHFNDIISEFRKHDRDTDAKYSVLGIKLNKIGIHTIAYKNAIEDPDSTSYMITHPKQVRVLKKTTGPLNLQRGSQKVERF